MTVHVSDPPRCEGGVHLALPGRSSITGAVRDVLLAFDSPDLAGRLIPALSAGLLSSMFVHRLNNSLVSVVGNLEIASMYGWEGGESEGPCRDARDASMMLADRLLDLAGVSAGVHDGAAGDSLPLLNIAAEAGGRSVAVLLDWPGWVARFAPACVGLSTACMLSINGAGSLRAVPEGTALRMTWEKSAAFESTPSVSSFSVPFLVASSALSVFRCGGRLLVEEWNDSSGSVVLFGEGDSTD